MSCIIFRNVMEGCKNFSSVSSVFVNVAVQHEFRLPVTIRHLRSLITIGLKPSLNSQEVSALQSCFTRSHTQTYNVL